MQGEFREAKHRSLLGNLAENQCKAAFFGRTCKGIWQTHRAKSFSNFPYCRGRSVAQVLISQGCSYSEGGKKYKIVLIHQCAKCSSDHVSARLRESAPVIINDLTVRSECVNVRYASMLCAGLDRQWLFKKSLCFCVGAGSAHPNSA